MFMSVNEFQFNPSEDLAKAAVTSLRQSGLFKDAYFTYGGEKANADLLFSGQIQSTAYKGVITRIACQSKDRSLVDRPPGGVFRG